MSISCYSGLMGSGKTYEVVLSVIIPAIKGGRRVVTNISGIDSDAIRAYCAEKFEVQLNDCGHVVYAKNEEVANKDFFPVENSSSDHECKSFVLAGDLVCVDEAYKIWGTDCKILNEHKVFFREHRHYVHPKTGVACDLVLMTQDIGDLHRLVKVVIEQSFRCHKAKGVGLNSVYTIAMWEGWKQPAKLVISDWTRKYDSEIFPLYKSYASEELGKESSTDSRQNVFNDKRLLIKIVLMVVLMIGAGWRIYHFFADKISPLQNENHDSSLSSGKKTTKTQVESVN